MHAVAGAITVLVAGHRYLDFMYLLSGFLPVVCLHAVLHQRCRIPAPFRVLVPFVLPHTPPSLSFLRPAPPSRTSPFAAAPGVRVSPRTPLAPPRPSSRPRVRCPARCPSCPSPVLSDLPHCVIGRTCGNRPPVPAFLALSLLAVVPPDLPPVQQFPLTGIS